MITLTSPFSLRDKVWFDRNQVSTTSRFFWDKSSVDLPWTKPKLLVPKIMPGILYHAQLSTHLEDDNTDPKKFKKPGVSTKLSISAKDFMGQLDGELVSVTKQEALVKANKTFVKLGREEVASLKKKRRQLSCTIPAESGLRSLEKRIHTLDRQIMELEAAIVSRLGK